MREHMTDETTKRGPADPLRVNVHEEHEVQYWAEKFGVTPEALKEGVSSVGVMAEDVEKHVKSPSAKAAAAK